MKIRRLDLDDQSINQEHEALGIPPVEYEVTHPSDHPLLRIASYLVFAILTGLLLYLAYRLFLGGNIRSGTEIITDTIHDPMFWGALLVGLLAQIIDGALGMAYGITSSSFLLAVGASPAMASGATTFGGSIHLWSVWCIASKNGNVNKKLFFSLLIPGIVGGLIGTYILNSIDGNVLKPYISLYLLVMGLYVLSKAFRKIQARYDINAKKIAPLALFGGLMDTTGGGGWGPIVTTSLVGSGHDPRTTIGSVNFAEFFLTVTVATALFSILDQSVWIIVAGLVIGGLFAAPFAAYITRHLKTKTLLILVGSLISLISVFNLYKAFIHI